MIFSSVHSERRAIRQGFSLVEVLLAVFILGIGIISISVLFPAGIELQRQSQDALNGPLVAEHAIQLIRSRVSENDFGDLVSMAAFKGESVNQWESEEEDDLSEALGRVPGDWGWKRPGLKNQSDLRNIETGKIRIFTDIIDADFVQDLPGIRNVSIPWNTDFSERPQVDFAQGERCWPLADSETPPSQLGNSKYFWDCLFSRRKGRIYVAVFVYRIPNIRQLGGGYAVLPATGSLLWMPSFQLLDEPWDAPSGGSGFNAGSREGRKKKIIAVNTDPVQSLFSWQRPEQKLIDQSGRIHRIKAGRRSVSDDQIIELEPPPKALLGQSYVTVDVVRTIWFTPMITPSLIVNGTEVEVSLRPVHAQIYQLSSGGGI